MNMHVTYIYCVIMLAWVKLQVICCLNMKRAILFSFRGSIIARMLRFTVSSFTGQDRNKIGSSSQPRSSRVLYFANNSSFRVRLSEFQNFCWKPNLRFSQSCKPYQFSLYYNYYEKSHSEQKKYAMHLKHLIKYSCSKCIDQN